ncbi:MAG: hypothetical protein ACI9W4_000083 [Rhodothermales bacterium]|jgi:hypothetical protein
MGAIRAKPWLAVLLFSVHAVLGYLIATPIGAALTTTFGAAGFEEIDIALLADIPEALAGAFASVFGLLMIATLILFLWSSAAGVGLPQALRQGGARSFWSGVDRYFWKSLGLTGLFLVPMGIWTGIVAGVAIVFALTLSSEVIQFWTVFVAVPAVWLTGMAAIDLTLDYARIALVSSDSSVVESAKMGFRRGLRRWAAHGVYLVWFVPSLLLLLLPTELEMSMGASFGLFLLQQVVLLGRSFISVGWMGSQVALYEDGDQPEAITG